LVSILPQRGHRDVSTNQAYFSRAPLTNQNAFFASFFRLLIFALRHLRQALAMRALTLTSTVYGCLFFVSLYHLLLHF